MNTAPCKDNRRTYPILACKGETRANKSVSITYYTYYNVVSLCSKYLIEFYRFMFPYILCNQNFNRNLSFDWNKFLTTLYS